MFGFDELTTLAEDTDKVYIIFVPGEDRPRPSSEPQKPEYPVFYQNMYHWNMKNKTNYNQSS
jgi:hypothetical protein